MSISLETEKQPNLSSEGRPVALYMQSFAGGGAERVMINLAQGLAARGLRVDMVVSRTDGPYLSLLSPNVRLIDLNCRRSLHSIPGLIRYLRQEKPQALLSAMGPSNLIALWAKTAARYPGRVVISVHINISMHYRHSGRLSNRLFLKLFQIFYPLADAVVAVSQDAANDLTDSVGLSPSKIRMIYNPVISPALLEQAGQAIAHPWFAPGQPPVILAAGRLSEQKDFLTLIRAFAKIREQCQARLVILGEGPDRSLLEAAILEHGLTERVEMPGFTANPYAYMKQAAVYVLSSRWEGLPTVLIEAMACGTPVISTDCPSGPREILQAGLLGVLVPVGDSDAMASAILQTLEEVANGTRSSAPLSGLDAYYSGRAAENYEQVLLRS